MKQRIVILWDQHKEGISGVRTAVEESGEIVEREMDKSEVEADDPARVERVSGKIFQRLVWQKLLRPAMRVINNHLNLSSAFHPY